VRLAKAQLTINVDISSSGEISDVVVRSQCGDEEAFHHLFKRYSRPVLDFIYNMIGDRELAAELMQETFVRAYKNLSNLKETGKFSTWLFGIAKNAVREAIRERQEERRNVGLDEPSSLQIEDEKIKPDEKILNSELNDAIRRVLFDLNEDWRTVFILKFFNHQSYEEISEITGWSMGKVKTDLHRARLEMKRRLQSYLPGNDR
jgi:RNA polymerase sigma-70 factor, ECF subfamily